MTRLFTESRLPVEIDAKFYNDLLAESLRLRKAAGRMDRLRQKLKAQRKELRRLNQWIRTHASGVTIATLRAELARALRFELERKIPRGDGITDDTTAFQAAIDHREWVVRNLGMQNIAQNGEDR